jgi:uroporphyrinogen-III decarboxylase
MAEDVEKLYNDRMERYCTAMKNAKPDKVPTRLFAAEAAGKFLGYNAQDVTHDVDKGLDAVIEMCKVLNLDATVVNMVYVWTGMTESYGTRYYKVPGIDIDEDQPFQYWEPRTEEEAFMKADEYDRFIEDPNEFVMNVWAPRISKYFVAPGEENTAKNNLAWLKGGISMITYFDKLIAQVDRMKDECGTVSAIAGALKAPFDILADKFRGFRGIAYDIHRQPEKVLKAAEAVMPHMKWNATAFGDPDKKVPISLWMHRGATGFFSEENFEKFFWPTLKQVTEEIFAEGWQVLYYAEGKWARNWKHFRELPDGSIIYHCDKDDVFEAHKALGDKFAISGGIPNDLLALGTPEEVKGAVKKVLQSEVAKDGGYILDAEAIIQQDATVENMKALVEACEEYGVYKS